MSHEDKLKVHYQKYLDDHYTSHFHLHYPSIEAMSFLEWLETEYRINVNKFISSQQFMFSTFIAFILSILLLVIQPFKFLLFSSYLLITIISFIIAISMVSSMYIKLRNEIELNLLINKLRVDTTY